MKNATIILLRSILMLAFCLTSLTQAQTSSGQLRGVVTDARGAAVSGARVVLLYGGKVATRETRTAAAGEFFVGDLRPGAYSIAVEAPGLTQSGGPQPVEIRSGQEFRIALPMIVAALKDAVVVSATRTDTAIGENAAGAFIASGSAPGDYLRRAQRIQVFDALRSSPGVTVVQTGRRGGVTSLFVRGGESDYTKVLIDGIPVNDGGGSYDFSDLTTDNAARVELVRGAQSAIYGSDAMTGVLQFFTHRGTTRVPELEYSAEGGSFAFNRQFLRASGANGPLDYSASFTHLRTDGRTRNDDYENRVASLNLGYRFGDRTQFRATARRESSGLGVPGTTAVLFADPDERARRRRVAVTGRLENQTTARWHQSLSFVYSQSRSLNFDPAAQDLSQPATPPDTTFAFNDFQSFFNNHQRRRGLRYQTTLALNNFIIPGSHFISGGVDYEQERAVFTSGFNLKTIVAAERRNLGAYIQDQLIRSPRLAITAGVRIENNRADLPASFATALTGLNSTPFTGTVGFGTEVVPKISGVYVLRQSGIQSRRGMTKLKGNWGRGIKAPTLLEAFSPSPFFLGNPGLKPERARNYDVGLEQFFLKDRVRVEAYYFENKFRDQIAFVGDPASFGGPVKLADGRLTSYVNNDKATVRGFELALAWNPKRYLQFSGNYTLLDTDLEAAADVVDFNTGTLVPNREVGLPLLRRPRHSGSFNAAYIGRKFTANFDAFFVGQRRDGDPITFSRFTVAGQPIYNDGYAKLDLAGAYEIVPQVSIFARIENLLNQDYQEVLGYPAYKLNFSAGLRFKIGGGR